MDALKLGRALTHIRDTQARGSEFINIVTEYRDDMLARGKTAIEKANGVLADYGKYADFKFFTFGKEAVPLAEARALQLPEVKILPMADARISVQ